MHTEDTNKLLWYFEEPLEDNIFVLDNKWDPSGPKQPYAQSIEIASALGAYAQLC